MATGSVFATAGAALSQQDAEYLRIAAISVAVYEWARHLRRVAQGR